MIKEAFEYITNWDKATVADLEANGLLDTISKIHIIGFQMHNMDTPKYILGSEKERMVNFFKWHEDNNIPIVFHNGVGYDKRACEKVLGIDLNGVQIIDTLWLSYYLNLDRVRHSIEELGKDYPEAVDKFHVDEGDWGNLTEEQAIKRVTSDVEIGSIIWEDFKERLVDMHTRAKQVLSTNQVGGKRVSKSETLWIDNLKGLSVEEYVARTIGYFSALAEIVALQEDTGWLVDVEYLTEHLERLEALAQVSKEKLESVMPPIPVYRPRKAPAKPFKKDGTLSKGGESWETLKDLLRSGEVDSKGNVKAKVEKEGYIHELVGYDKPNINSSQQVKDFLFSNGWRPQTFNFVRDNEAFDEWAKSRPPKGSHRGAWKEWNDSKPEERAIPQIKDGGELCRSIQDLAAKIPEVGVLEEYSVILHRIGVLKGIYDSMDKDNRVKATAHNVARTLRLQHRKPIVNLPSVKSLHGEGIRGSLVAGEGQILLGSDLSSLEDRIKIHLITPHDPKLAAKMSSDSYCPHITQGVAMGTITPQEGEGYISETLSGDDLKRVSGLREDAKPVVYLSAYKGGWRALQRQTGWDEDRCKDAIDAYWEVNWSIDTVADEQVVIKDNLDQDWIVHPISGMLVNLKSAKDKFNTVAQSCGAFFQTIWLLNVINEQKRRWGKATMTANIHRLNIVDVKPIELSGKLRDINNLYSMPISSQALH